MCGIAGLWGNVAGSTPGDAVSRRMAGQIRHRGPDDEGIWSDQDRSIFLAHRRLSIIDLSPAGHQPMTSACGRFVLVFNGEIYNHKELRRDLDGRAHSPKWRGYSDTEVLLAAIVEWGLIKALKRSVGMFALAIWDTANGTLSLARDRLGEKPLYYGRIGESFAFASEVSALTVVPGWRGEIDRDALALMMRLNCIPAPFCIYRGISKLQPGHVLTLSSPGGEPKLETYWSVAEAANDGSGIPFMGDAEDAVNELDRLLREAIAGQMIADVPLGAFLSGGIDSSTVVALMQAMSSRPVHTFTIGFEQRDYDEGKHARDVATHLGTDHTELTVTEREAQAIIPELPTIYCEPFSDSSQIPTLIVARLARRNVTVSLSGDGGDELFSGYNRYAVADKWKQLSSIPLPLRQLYARIATCFLPSLYDRTAAALARVVPPLRQVRQLGDKVHKSARVAAQASVADVYRTLTSHWDEPKQLVILGCQRSTPLTEADLFSELGSDVKYMMALDLMTYLPDDILVKVDRAAMSCSLETRIPLLDHRIVEFALSLPVTVLRHNSQSKWPLRQLLYRHVPKDLVERPKMGFAVPIDSWLRGPLRDWAEDLLSPERLQIEGYFNPAPIRKAWAEHLSGRRNLQHELWDVLMFQAWLAAQR